MRLPPRWAVVCAHLAALTPVPSGLWRIGIALGLPLGYTESETRELFDVPGAGVVYLVGLTVTIELLAFLAVGLVRPWGEQVPHWVPMVGGRALPRRPVVLAAGVGAAARTALWVPFVVLWWFTDGDGHLSGQPHAWVGLAYLPLGAWGPLLAAVAWSYHERHGGRGSAITREPRDSEARTGSEGR